MLRIDNLSKRVLRTVAVLLAAALLCTGMFRFTAVAASTGTPTFSISSGIVPLGKKVSVNISINDNPGLVSFRLKVSYPHDKLTLTSTQTGVFADMVPGPLDGDPFVITWCDAINPDSKINGRIITLIFEVNTSESALGECPITLSYDPDDVFNRAGENVTFAAASGALAIVQDANTSIAAYGDANNDRKVDSKDIVRLRKYLSAYDYTLGYSTVTLDVRGADANGDGAIDSKDVVRLRKYFAAYDYETGTSPVKLGPESSWSPWIG